LTAVIQIRKPRIDTGRFKFGHKKQQTQTSSLSILDIITWTQSEFYIPELSGPIKLYPYQIAALREALSKDDNGNYRYNLVVWGDIKKSAKSSIAAARALYAAFTNQWASIKIVANDLKQADSRVAFYLRRALELNPHYVKDTDYKQAGYRVTLPVVHSTIEAIPIDPGGEAGGNDDLMVFSELWDARHKAILKMWTELTISPTKFGKSQRWVETYAGYSGESPILEPIYERGIVGEHLDLSYTDDEGYHDLTDLEVYRTGSMLMLWNTIPRLPFQTPEYYTEEEENLLPEEFQRVHRNKWVSSVSKFVEKTWWQNCYEPLPALTPGESCILAADAPKGSEDKSYLADSFSLVLVTRHPSNPKHIAVRYCGIWQPDKGQLLDFLPIEEEIRRLVSTFSILEFTYDPYQLHDMAMRFRREGIVNAKEFKQGVDRLKADKQLRDVIINKRIAHDGNPLLTQHIDNANVVSHGEEGIRIIKRQPHLKIDAAVALSEAVSRCYYFSLG
jgi:phage terminase large subunit-like protein